MRFNPEAGLLIGLSFFLSPPVQAQQEKGTRYAFLVACGPKYNKGQLNPLPKTVEDLQGFEKALAATGFDDIVFLRDDTPKPERYLPEKDKIITELKLLLASVGPDDTLVVALNGHGLHFDGDKTSYFCPLNTKIADKKTMIPMDGPEGLYTILNQHRQQQLKRGSKACRILMIAGMCRNDPKTLPKNAQAAAQVDLDLNSPEEVPQGIAAIYSCKPGQKTYFDPQGGSYFFKHLNQAWLGKYHEDAERLDLEMVNQAVIRKTSSEVRKELGEAQVPELRREYSGEWIIGRVEKKTETIAFKVGTESFKMELVKIKGGKFKMGSSKEELALVKQKFDNEPDDEKEHEVELSTFFMGKYPVTKGQFRLFVKDKDYKTEAEEGDGAYGWNRAKKTYEKSKDYSWKNPGYSQDDDHPVVCVSWNDAKKFCEWVSAKSGKKVSLPSEAQWEYGCRAGRKTLYSFGDDPEDLKDYANVADASFRKETGLDVGIKGDDGYAFTSPVGKFKGNRLGLYDMHGNVWQWCADGYQKDYENLKGKDPIGGQSNDRRVLRGGSWFSFPRNCRAASRIISSPDSRYLNDGFRVVVLP